MKKITNTIRIGLVPKLSANEPTSKAHEQNLNQLFSAQLMRHTYSPDIKHRQLNDVNSRLSSAPTLSQQQQKPAKVSELARTTSTSIKKKVVIGSIIGGVVIAIIATAIALGIILSRSSSEATTTIPTSTVSFPVETAYWPFDGTTGEFYNIYNGSLPNGGSYSSAASTNMPYVGYGQALLLSASLFQFVSITSPFLNLSYRSFTIEAWIYFSSTSINDRGLVGQCQCQTCSNQCFYFILRVNRLYAGFTSNELTGTTDLTTGVWHHVAFIYNYETKQQILYLNGVQDGIKSNSAPYQGQNGSLLIGSTQIYFTTNYFNGYIDNLRIITRAKTSDEILRDASLIAYYSFDSPNPSYDSGPNGVTGTAINTTTVPGRINEAMRFVGMGSFFQIYGIYNMVYGVSSNRPFSISMWIYPTTTTSGIFVQALTTSLSTFSCLNLLGLYAFASSPSVAGQLFVQSNSGGQAVLTGPFVFQNSWTHITLTHTSTAGYKLYVNGVYFGNSGGFSYTISFAFGYVSIGYRGLSCSSSSVNSPYQGAIDEIYIHNRELTQTDVTALANP